MSGNVITTQTLLDGPRNVVIKIDGYVDTSDVAVTGQIGASGFTTTTGARTIAFVAGALLPTLGQPVTFGDSAATFPAGTYITAITDATHITVNNAALKDNAAAAVTITGSTAPVVIADPVLLSAMDNSDGTLATKLRIDEIKWTVDEGLAVTLLWKATANVKVIDLVKTGNQCLKHFGGYTNNAGTGITGQILLSTEGWSSGKIYEFTVTLELVKQ